jgi:hypothetical protein
MIYQFCLSLLVAQMGFFALPYTTYFYSSLMVSIYALPKLSLKNESLMLNLETKNHP